MSCKKAFHLIVLGIIGSILIPIFGLSQSPAAIASKDTSAAAIAQRSLAAMGAATLVSGQTLMLSGSISVEGATPVTFPINIKSRGTSQLRSELSAPKGTRVTVTSDGQVATRQADGSVRWLTSENSVNHRNEYLPALSLLSEYRLPTTSIENIGSTTVDGDATDVIALAINIAPLASDLPQLAQLARTLFYVNHETGYVSRIQQMYASENVKNSLQTLEIRYSDYRQVTGIMVPFHQQTYADGKLLFDLTLTSVDFAASVTDSDFDLEK